MLETKSGLMDQIRDRFAHVDECPFTGSRIFFENAGGALTLKTAVDTSSKFAAIPDNQGRDNPASQALVSVIEKARADMSVFFNTSGGQFFVGESGTEVLFRLIRTAVVASPGGNVVGSTLEHPATRSAARKWAEIAGKEYLPVKHDDETGSVEAEAYATVVNSETRVATILHTSPVTGMGVDVQAVAAAIRKVSPGCFIIVDGIQHAAHGHIDIDAYGIDGYAVSPYKVFSRHGYGVGWTSDRLQALPHDNLIGGPELNWELGTRDTGSYATFSDVVEYMDWLGWQFSTSSSRRERIEAAASAIHEHEKTLTNAMLFGTGNIPGLSELDGLTIVGGVDNPRREGLVSFWSDRVSSSEIVERLNANGVRCHIRKADHYSGNILTPLERQDCVRVSIL